MSIPDHAGANFQTLLRAAAAGEPRYVICAVDRDDGDYVLTPFGHLAPGNPYEAYVPPAESSGPAQGLHPVERKRGPGMG